MPPDFTRCEERFSKQWGKIEDRGSGVCPTEGDEVEMEEVTNLFVVDAAIRLSGAMLTTTTATTTTTMAPNTPPEMTSVGLTPATAFESTTLTCSPSASDDDGDSVSVSYQWEVNAVVIGATGNTLTGSSFGQGDLVTCDVTPSDVTDFGSSVTSNAVTIQ